MGLELSPANLNLGQISSQSTSEKQLDRLQYLLGFRTIILGQGSSFYRVSYLEPSRKIYLLDFHFLLQQQTSQDVFFFFLMLH